jgi:hypothetical protein
MIVIFGALTYWLYRRYRRFHDFEDEYVRISKLKPYEYVMVGPVMFEAGDVKYPQKYLTREEYHDWIDNDIRSL